MRQPLVRPGKVDRIFLSRAAAECVLGLPGAAPVACLSGAPNPCQACACVMGGVREGQDCLVACKRGNAAAVFTMPHCITESSAVSALGYW